MPKPVIAWSLLQPLNARRGVGALGHHLMPQASTPQLTDSSGVCLSSNTTLRLPSCPLVLRTAVPRASLLEPQP